MRNLQNKVQLTGRLGADPTLQKTNNGNSYLKLRVATNETHRSPDGELIKQALWHDLVAWGRTAELMSKLLKKGSEAVIKGKLKYNSYQDAEGIKRHKTRIQVDEFAALT